MSDLIVGEGGPDKTGGSEIFRREFPAEFSRSGDGRTLELRVVPYNQVARVSDPPYFQPYEEMFVPGAFERQLSAPNRVSVFVNVEHEQGIKGVVGRGTSLREVSDDGLHGTFRMLDHPDADKALQLVNEGDLTGVSLEFESIKSVREGGVVKRLKARLINVALVRPSGSSNGVQAYKEAGVLAVRESPEPSEPDPDPEPDPDEEASPRELTHADVQEVTAEIERAARVTALLERVGYQPVLRRTVSREPWDSSTGRFTDEQYAQSCLVDRGGGEPALTRCSLPCLEPNGDLNANALEAAAVRLNRLTNVTLEQKSEAARKLRRYYGIADMEVPPSVLALAARA